MRISTIDEPAEKCAQAIERMQSHIQQPIALFVSGGSSLSVVEYLSDAVCKSIACVFVIDERWGVSEKYRNSEQFYETSFYTRLLENENAYVIEPDFFMTRTVEEAEQKYAAFLEDRIIKRREDLCIVALLGMGEDGHIAGMMPQKSEMLFRELFDEDVVFVRGYDTGHVGDFDTRITVTKTFLENISDHIYVVCAGPEKSHALCRIEDEREDMHTTPARMLSSFMHAQIFTDQDLHEKCGYRTLKKKAIVLDFDHTLFNTTLYVDILRTRLAEEGVAPDLFNLHRNTLKTCCSLVDVDRFVDVLPIEDKRRIHHVIHDTITTHAQSFVFDDVASFIDRYRRQYAIIVVTQGDYELQSEKVRHSHISGIDHVFISQSSKDIVFARIIDDYDHVVFVDDKARHIDEVKEEYPTVTTYFLKRPEDHPYGHIKSKCQCADHTIQGLNNIKLPLT